MDLLGSGSGGVDLLGGWEWWCGPARRVGGVVWTC